MTLQTLKTCVVSAVFCRRWRCRSGQRGRRGAGRLAEKSFFRACVAVFRAFILTFAVKKILLDMILIADSGSTKTDWWLADGGHVVRRAASQGINPFHQFRHDTLPKILYFYRSIYYNKYIPYVIILLLRNKSSIGRTRN